MSLLARILKTIIALADQTSKDGRRIDGLSRRPPESWPTEPRELPPYKTNLGCALAGCRALARVPSRARTPLRPCASSLRIEHAREDPHRVCASAWPRPLRRPSTPGARFPWSTPRFHVEHPVADGPPTRVPANDSQGRCRSAPRSISASERASDCAARYAVWRVVPPRQKPSAARPGRS
jgi:hypothetical protein